MARPESDPSQGDIRLNLVPPVVSLPRGGGAIQGIGEKFSTNPTRGTESLVVPIPVSPGRSTAYNGHGPRPQARRRGHAETGERDGRPHRNPRISTALLLTDARTNSRRRPSCEMSNAGIRKLVNAVRASGVPVSRGRRMKLEYPGVLST